MKPTFLLRATAAIIPMMIAGAAHAQDGFYTAEQVQRGQELYDARCSVCHANSIRDSYQNSTATAATIVDAMVLNGMPLDNPGGLPAQDYVDIAGYILNHNGMALGDEVVAGTAAVQVAAIGADPADIANVVLEETAEAAPARDYSPVTPEMILNPDPSEWLQWRRTVDNQGHSPLDLINRDTVGELELAWTYPMGVPGLQEVAPIVHDGIMFLATNQNNVMAVDAVTGDTIWMYTHTRPEFEGAYHGRQAERQKNSVALWQDSVILTTVDGRLMSLDALSGQVEWDVQVHDWEKGYSYTAGPLVVDGKIFSGISGCSIAGTNGGCFITAHDADTGEEIWRFNTIDDPNNPLVDESWGGVPAENRWGATPWATGSYDAELNMVFFGTGMPIPYSELTRGTGEGSALYTNSTLAIDADTGELKWYYQHMPRDNFDLDSPFERIIIEEEIDGEMRKLVVTTPGKNGITFALDAATGEFIWSKETIYQNVIESIDQETGEITLNLDTIPTEIGEEKLFCPTFNGGRLWQATAYSPDTGMFYLPAANICQTITPLAFELAPTGESMGLAQTGPQQLAPGHDNVGSLFALNVLDGSDAFEVEQPARFSSSVLATGGGLIFVGDANRYVYAMNDETGEVLWTQRLHAPIGGYPMTYEIDGIQYVAIPAGQSATTQVALTPGMSIPPITGANMVYVYRLTAE
ncbi:PQQ-binding-like beta-propeller repeat protein [Ketogulonicigenium vulgare]|uniref:outer membrane protein assembly factor BamB family protein n=1 Tax=Ketogulonicigenium vulgare TaxID=92945 RepID=UPI0023598F66|nr:PQQ-binding-like beta-propeller repeat protein [Ketogulonicigenium vulgare]